MRKQKPAAKKEYIKDVFLLLQKYNGNIKIKYYSVIYTSIK